MYGSPSRCRSGSTYYPQKGHGVMGSPDDLMRNFCIPVGAGNVLFLAHRVPALSHQSRAPDARMLLAAARSASSASASGYGARHGIRGMALKSGQWIKGELGLET